MAKLKKFWGFLVGMSGGPRPTSRNQKMDEVVCQVSSVISECLDTLNTEDVPNLDFLSYNLRCCLTDLGQLLEEMLISRQRHIDQAQLSMFLDLTQCVSELSNYYDSRLLRFSQRGFDIVMGRPKKLINITLVSLNNYNYNNDHTIKAICHFAL